MTVSYEDLISDTASVVKKIFSFCDLKIPDSLETKLPKIRPEPAKKWTKDLRPDDVKKIFEIVNASLKKMKYPYKP